MKSSDHRIFEHLREIDRKSPADVIVQQVKDLIANGVLKPGDYLPAERALAERFGVGRSYVREALSRLEFCGVLQTMPQSGTVVAGAEKGALDTLLAHVLDVEGRDQRAIIEMRGLLEVQAARLAAVRASNTDIGELEQIHADFCRRIQEGESGLEANVRFHVKIAAAAKNSVLGALIRLLAPNIVRKVKSCELLRDGAARGSKEEHEAILDGIRVRNPERAAAAMAHHMLRSQQKMG